MIQVSYADVFGLEPHRGDEHDVQAGDTVRTGSNLFPHFTVVAVSGETAWLRNVQSGMDGLTAVARCRRINGPFTA